MNDILNEKTVSDDDMFLLFYEEKIEVRFNSGSIVMEELYLSVNSAANKDQRDI